MYPMRIGSEDMTRPGNHIFLWILVTFCAMALFHPPGWLVIVAALAIGWYYNEQEAATP